MSLKKEKKKDRAAELIRNSHNIFKCPVCGDGMHLNDSYSLVCSSNHSFDISKKGYVNLLTSSNKEVYSRELFESRHAICSRGFYEPIIESLKQIIQGYSDSASGIKEVTVLDAGCGEGSYLCNLYEKIKGELKANLIGADISKEGISIAATACNDVIWTVSDLTRLPLKNKSIDIILNILSPANYPEFERILSDDGIIIKVIPGEFYLQELRKLVINNRSYSNQNVIDHFSKRLKLLQAQNISYQYSIDEDLLPDLIKMTPLTWGKTDNRDLDLHQIDIKAITVDLTVMAGKVKRPAAI